MTLLWILLLCLILGVEGKWFKSKKSPQPKASKATKKGGIRNLLNRGASRTVKRDSTKAAQSLAGSGEANERVDGNIGPGVVSALINSNAKRPPLKDPNHRGVSLVPRPGRRNEADAEASAGLTDGKSDGASADGSQAKNDFDEVQSALSSMKPGPEPQQFPRVEPENAPKKTEKQEKHVPITLVRPPQQQPSRTMGSSKKGRGTRRHSFNSGAGKA